MLAKITIKQFDTSPTKMERRMLDTTYKDRMTDIWERQDTSHRHNHTDGLICDYLANIPQYKNRELSTRAVKDKNVIYLGLVSVQIVLTLDQERRVIQLAVNVRNVLTLSVVMACTGIKFHMRTVLVKK